MRTLPYLLWTALQMQINYSQMQEILIWLDKDMFGLYQNRCKFEKIPTWSIIPKINIIFAGSGFCQHSKWCFGHSTCWSVWWTRAHQWFFVSSEFSSKEIHLHWIPNNSSSTGNLTYISKGFIYYSKSNLWFAMFTCLQIVWASLEKDGCNLNRWKMSVLTVSDL